MSSLSQESNHCALYSTFLHRTHQYTLQGFDASGSKTLDFRCFYTHTGGPQLSEVQLLYSPHVHALWVLTPNLSFIRRIWTLYTAVKQTFRANAQWCCLSAKPTLQSLCGLSNIIISVHTVVLICFCKTFLQTGYHTMPTCSHSNDVFLPSILPQCPLHFFSI
jgi:hypothetical protein